MRGAGQRLEIFGTGSAFSKTPTLPQAQRREPERLLEDVGKARSPYALINFLQRQRNGDLAASGVFL